MNKPHLDLTGCKILVVDDVPTNLEVLYQTLHNTGYNVLVASDGTTGIEVAGYSVPDLILLDVMMPGIDGYEACRRLKADPSMQEIPIVFLTARDDLNGIIEGFQAGGVDYVTNPFKTEELLVRIQGHQERTLLARELAALNAHLEEKVEERTLQLRSKVRELEGKDRISQHMLTVNTLEETLEEVLKVIADILELDKAIIYLKTEDDLQPAAAIGLSGSGELAAREQLQQLVPTRGHQSAFTAVEEHLQPVNITEPTESAIHPFTIVPISRGDTLLGLIEVDNHRSDRSISDVQLQTLVSFALQAAVAIYDAQVQQDSNKWEEELDEVLGLEEELEEIELFEDLTRNLDK